MKHLIKLVLFIFCIVFTTSVVAQITTISLFKNYSSQTNQFQKFVTAAETAEFDTAKALQILQANPSNLVLTLQFENKNWEIILNANTLLSQHFFIQSASDANINKNTIETVLHYKGFIKNNKKSIAAVSIFKDKMVAVIADENGNINIGQIKEPVFLPNKTHIIYREHHLTQKNTMLCASDNITTSENNPLPVYSQTAATTATLNAEPVDVYFETDYQIYLNNSSNISNVVNYVTALFNVVNVIYNNDSINTRINAIKVWNIPDPYISFANASLVLSNFSSNMAVGFPGDLAHFLSQRSLGGGVAYLNSICSSNTSKCAVSGNLSNSFNPYPTYSWSVMVITHELGHNLGSPHTQSCSWPGGAIDNCYTTEGGCGLGPAPPNGGTIMSYCHLTGYGINLANGFGALPGQRIRNNLRNNLCLNPGIYFENTSQFVAEDSANIENGCLPYKVVTTKIKMPYAASQPALINVTAAPAGELLVGTNKDVEVSPLTFTLDSNNLSQLITIKVYNDAIVENQELLTLGFTLNANGGNAVKRNIQFNDLVSIASSDQQPDSTLNIPLFTETFNTITSDFGGWTPVVLFGNLSPNRWKIGSNGGADFSTKAAYVSADNNSLSYAGTTLNDSTIIQLQSPTINASGFKNISLGYLYKCAGEYSFVNGGNGTLGSTVYKDYGQVLYSINNGLTWSVARENMVGRPTKLLETIVLPDSANNCSTLKIAFEWRNNASTVINPAFIIDSLFMKGTSTCSIQTLADAANTTEEYLGANQTIHFYNKGTTNIMATIQNLSNFDFGCTKVEIIRTGLGAANAWSNLPTDKVADKVYKITAANNNSNAPYNVKLYYTANEINGWLAATGNSMNDLRVVKTGADISLPNPPTAAMFSSEYNRAPFGTTANYVFSSNFTGFSTFSLMKPFVNNDCPMPQNILNTTITGSNYQWQVNNGNGYTAIADDIIYSNSATNTLQINNAPLNYFGNLYRCAVTTTFGGIYSPESTLKSSMIWVGNVSTAWENPLNWSCNAVPDNKTDVYINTGATNYPQVNVTTTIKSLTAFSATAVTIKTGAALNIIDP